jgi:prepilin-type N-terminal cleavage/methylation domain-containing protein
MSERRQEGFSLVELLIVVAVIGIIAAIAIPGLITARRRAMEASAISGLKGYSSAQATYYSAKGNFTSYGSAADLLAGQFFDRDILTIGKHNGYQYTFTLAPGGVNFTGDARPIADPANGYHYFVDDSYVVRQEYGSYAGPNSPVVGS